MFDRSGNLWLEYDPVNTVRIRRIARDGGERVSTAYASRVEP